MHAVSQIGSLILDDSYSGATATALSEKTASAQRNAVFLTGSEYMIPELIIGGEWTTTIKLTNRGTAQIPTTNVFFLDDAGKPMIATFQTTSGQTVTNSGFSFALAPGSIAEATFTGTSTVRFGYASIGCNANGCVIPGLHGEATLRNRNATRPDFESVFPLETPAPDQYMLFDGRNGVTTVLYIVNPTGNDLNPTLDVLDVNNKVVKSVQFPLKVDNSIILSLHGNVATETVGIQGTLRLRGGGSSGWLVMTGLRINPSNSFTPMRAFVPK